jgi:tetratricopeptide (TPR) repeat protein
MGLELADHGKEEKEPGVIPDPEARDYARLGDMLRARDRSKAAAEEYAKAYAKGPSAPGVASRHALGRIALGRYEEALQVTSSALELYPDLGVLWLRKGQALSALGRPGDAAGAFREVLEINPFDPYGRAGLLAAARETGDRVETERQQWALKVLGMEQGNQ